MGSLGEGHYSLIRDFYQGVVFRRIIANGFFERGRGWFLIFIHLGASQ